MTHASTEEIMLVGAPLAQVLAVAAQSAHMRAFYEGDAMPGDQGEIPTVIPGFGSVGT